MPEVVYGSFEPRKEEYDILDITVISLSKEFEKSGSDIIRLLGTIFMPMGSLEEKRRTLEDGFGIPMTEELKEDLTNMCNLGDGILEYGFNKGEARGAIKEAIKLYRDELELMPAEIISKIMMRFNLGRDEAEKYVEEVLGLVMA